MAANKATKYARGEALVVPTLSIKGMKEGESLRIEVKSDPHYQVSTNDKGEIQYNKDGTEKQLGTIRAVNIDTGELGQLVLSAIVDRAFKDFMAERGSLVGHAFELVRGKSLGTGKANLWEVHELVPA